MSPSRFVSAHRWSVVTVLAIIALAAVALPKASPQAQKAFDVRQKQGDGLKRNGLAGAAAVTGSYVGRAPFPGTGGPLNLDELAELSPTVIVGPAESNVSKLTENGRGIATFYSVRVEAALKGNNRQGDAVTVMLPGGRVSFPDGSWAQLNTPGFEKPRNGQRCMWFLRRVPPGALDAGPGEAFTTTSGPLGLYQLPPNGFIRPSGYYTSPLAQSLKQRRLDSDAFVATVRQVVK